MARSDYTSYSSTLKEESYNSAGSQFFIMTAANTSLDGNYAGFGKVTKGIEIVDKICEDVEVEDNNGTVLKVNQPIIEKVSIID